MRLIKVLIWDKILALKLKIVCIILREWFTVEIIFVHRFHFLQRLKEFFRISLKRLKFKYYYFTYRRISQYICSRLFFLARYSVIFRITLISDPYLIFLLSLQCVIILCPRTNLCSNLNTNDQLVKLVNGTYLVVSKLVFDFQYPYYWLCSLSDTLN